MQGLVEGGGAHTVGSSGQETGPEPASPGAQDTTQHPRVVTVTILQGVVATPVVPGTRGLRQEDASLTPAWAPRRAWDVGLGT